MKTIKIPTKSVVGVERKINVTIHKNIPVFDSVEFNEHSGYAKSFKCFLVGTYLLLNI